MKNNDKMTFEAWIDSIKNTVDFNNLNELFGDYMDYKQITVPLITNNVSDKYESNLFAAEKVVKFLIFLEVLENYYTNTTFNNETKLPEIESLKWVKHINIMLNDYKDQNDYNNIMIDHIESKLKNPIPKFDSIANDSDLGFSSGISVMRFLFNLHSINYFVYSLINTPKKDPDVAKSLMYSISMDLCNKYTKYIEKKEGTINLNRKDILRYYPFFKYRREFMGTIIHDEIIDSCTSLLRRKPLERKNISVQQINNCIQNYFNNSNYSERFNTIFKLEKDDNTDSKEAENFFKAKHDKRMENLLRNITDYYLMIVPLTYKFIPFMPAVKDSFYCYSFKLFYILMLDFISYLARTSGYTIEEILDLNGKKNKYKIKTLLMKSRIWLDIYNKNFDYLLFDIYEYDENISNLFGLFKIEEKANSIKIAAYFYLIVNNIYNTVINIAIDKEYNFNWIKEKIDSIVDEFIADNKAKDDDNTAGTIINIITNSYKWCNKKNKELLKEQ